MAARDATERHEALLRLTPGRDRSQLEGRLERFAGLATAAGLDSVFVRQRTPGWGGMVRDAAPAADLEPDILEGLWKLCSGYAHGQSWTMLTAGSLERMGEFASPHEDVHDYKVTADVPTMSTIADAAVLVVNASLRLRERHRLRWTTKST